MILIRYGLRANESNMNENYILLFVGIFLVFFNKLFVKGFIWWETEVLKYNNPFSIRFLRIFCIVMGLVFLLISFLRIGILL